MIIETHHAFKNRDASCEETVCYTRSYGPCVNIKSWLCLMHQDTRSIWDNGGTWEINLY
jgi:hypothetical protein